MIGQKRIPSREGGIEIVVEKLATFLADRGLQVTCYNRTAYLMYDENFKEEEKYKGIRLKWVPTIKKRGWAAVSSSIIATVLAAFGPYDVLHFHAEGSCVLLWLPKLLGKKCVVTIHGLDYQRAKWGGFATAYILFGEKCAVRFADEIIVLSHNMQKYFQDKYRRDTLYIPNGVNKPCIRKANRILSEYGFKKDNYILYLGRLVPEKGIQYLIRAFHMLETDKKLVIAGAAVDSRRFLEELKALAYNDKRIVFTGFVQGELLDELYSNSYLYVLPSDVEGMPLSLLEAMSYGNCCLVSDIPENTEVIGHKAPVFRHGDVKDLAEKLQLLCNREDLVDQYRQRASAYICSRYSWKKTLERTLELYENILKRK